MLTALLCSLKSQMRKVVLSPADGVEIREEDLLGSWPTGGRASLGRTVAEKLARSKPRRLSEGYFRRREQMDRR